MTDRQIEAKIRQHFKNDLAGSTNGVNQGPSAFWSVSANGMLQQLGAAREGLDGEEAKQRLARYGSNLLKPKKHSTALTLLLGQFKRPLVLLLLFATVLSFFLRSPVNARITFAILLPTV